MFFFFFCFVVVGFFFLSFLFLLSLQGANVRIMVFITGRSNAKHPLFIDNHCLGVYL